MSANSEMRPIIGSMNRSTVAVFSGGIGLGAYQAGAYDALHARPPLRPAWLLGSSIGAVNAALIGGSHPDHCVATLRQFWSADDSVFPWQGTQGGYVSNWMSAIEARLFGVSGYFRPRIRSPFRASPASTTSRRCAPDWNG